MHESRRSFLHTSLSFLIIPDHPKDYDDDNDEYDDDDYDHDHDDHDGNFLSKKNLIC